MAYRIGFDGRAPVAPVDNGSNIYADPSLQFAKERTLDDIGNRVEVLGSLKKDNTINKLDERASTIASIATAVIAALAVVMVVAAHGAVLATGVGAAVLGLAVLGFVLTAYLKHKVDTTKTNETATNEVFLDARRRRIEVAIKNGQEEAEMAPVAGRVGYAPRTVAPTAPARRI